MRIYAFDGLRYDASAGEPGELAAPPFDQISDADRDRFHARHPHHFAHLTRPATTPQAAAELHAEWRAGGAVVRDERPALYPYVVELAGGGRRLGVAALVGQSPPEPGEIRPHEKTVEKTIAERLALLRATRTDLEPIMLLADDDGVLDGVLEAGLEGAEPLARHRDADGHHHLLYRLDDEAAMSRLRAALEPADGLIADGHHRYRVASEYAREVGAERGTAAAAKLAVVTSIRSTGLAIDPIHRGLSSSVDLEQMATPGVERRPLEGAHGAAIAAAVATAPGCAIGVAVGGRTPELWTLGGAPATTDEIPQAAAALAVSRLHTELLARLGLPASAATDGRVRYDADPERIFGAVAAGDLGCGFFLPPIAPADFAAAVSTGALMPPKSTRFLPKLASGLVWAAHDSRLA